MMSEAEERLERAGDGTHDSLPLGGWHGPTTVLSWPWWDSRGGVLWRHCG